MLRYLRLSLTMLFILIAIGYISSGQSIAIVQDDTSTIVESTDGTSAEDPDAPAEPEEGTDAPVTPAGSTAEEVKEAEITEPESVVEPEPEEEEIEEEDLEEEEIEEEDLEEEEAEVVDAESELPKRFGYDIFIGARNRIKRLEAVLAGATEARPAVWVPTPSRQALPEQAISRNIPSEQVPAQQTPSTSVTSTVRDAISGFVGPVEMMGSNVDATVPPKYVLGPGDRITLNFWSDVSEPQTVPLVVDARGEVILPAGAGKMVVRGMMLAQFQEAAREVLTRVAYADLKLVATLDGLRSIQIFIYGEAFRPGSYAVSAVTTLFNALYMCGGPSNNGSLRSIKLLRNKETISVDFYKVLIDGDSSQDLNLDAGDTIFIPPVGRTAVISGEVRRPIEYELKEGENLLQLISLAGGIKPGGYLQRVQIDSVRPGRERIVLDVDLSDQVDSPIFDGDAVTVFSIPSERMNTVTLEGEVKMPGIYELKDGMKVSDLIREAQRLPGEAYMERADLLRLNADEKTTKLIPVNLSKALAGDNTHDIILKQWDKLVVYSKWDVKWIADRVADVMGAVQRPGSYERSDDMTVDDLLILAGGTLPEAYLDRAFLLRLDERGEVTRSIPVNLKDSENSPLIEDGDSLLVYTHREARWEPRREVTVEGAVQTPEAFPRVDGMKVFDLIQRAGGLLPNAYPDRALLLRLDDRRRTTLGFFINPILALQDNPRNNLNLKDGDRLRIYTYQEATWEPEREVIVAGAVQDPNVFERFDGMKVSDLLYRAGGALPNAYLERADIRRSLPDHETYVMIPVNLSKALSGDEEADVLLQDEDLLTVHTLREAQYKPDNIVIIYGAVQRPDIYVRAIGMKLSDLLFIAGGLLPGAHREAEITRIGDDGRTLIQTVDVIALVNGDDSQDILLGDEDVVSIRKQTEFLDALRTVTILGQVKYPGSYALKRNERLSDLIERAGGLTDRAYPEALVMTRDIEYLTLDEQMTSTQQVKKLVEDLSRMEYQREVAKVLLVEQRSKGRSGPSLSIPSFLAAADGDTEEAYAGQGTVTEIAELAAVSGIPKQAETAVSEIESIDQSQYQYTLVTPAREMDSFLPTGRVVVNLKDAIDRPGTNDDITLEDGDRILIPVVPATISVSGAVIQPSSLVYMNGKSAKDYIEMVGGYARDADTDAVYIIKANGMVSRGDKTKLSPGDMIVVSTKVMVEKVTDRWGQVIGGLKFVVTTLAMAYTIKLILEQVK